METTTAVIGLVSGLVGAGLGILGALLSERFRRKEDRRGVASAVAGEIGATIYIADARNQVPTFKALAEKLLQQPPPDPPWVWLDKDTERDSILKAYIQRLGELGGDLPERVTRFYTILQVIRIDIARIASGEFNKNSAGASALITADIALWTDSARDALALVDDLHAIARGEA